MRRFGSFSKVLVVAGTVAVLSLGSIALRPAHAEGEDLSAKKCEAYPYTVRCKKNCTPGGPIGCFNTLCEAVAAGAYVCKPQVPACEP